MMRGLRQLLAALCGAGCLACAIPPVVTALPAPGPSLAILPLGPLPGEDARDATPGLTVLRASDVKKNVERQLRACLAASGRRVVGPKALRQIRARMRQEIAQAGDAATARSDVEATIDAYSMREFLDDHPEVTTLVRAEWRKLSVTPPPDNLTTVGDRAATWDGISYPIQRPNRSAWDRLVDFLGSGKPEPVEALSLHISFESRSGDAQSAVQGGIGLLQRVNDSGYLVPLEHGQVATDPSTIRQGIRHALASLCGDDEESEDAS